MIIFNKTTKKKKVQLKLKIYIRSPIHNKFNNYNLHALTPFNSQVEVENWVYGLLDTEIN